MKTVLYSLAFCFLLIAPDNMFAQVWQTAVEDGSKLGIRDKYGELGSYEAHFTVKIMDQIAFTASPVKVNGDEWGEVYWPFDFEDGRGQKLATFPPGYFKVEVKVNGEIVAKTEFKMTLEEFEKSVEEYKAQKIIERQ